MQKNIRNFCIIAHIDHGKSTIADRLMEYIGTVESRDMTSQLLDSMDLEKERGITIKLQAVKMLYNREGEDTFELNLIDTPGHVDFTYEVSRSLAACEGALLVVDAAQGIEAQTLANVYLALEHDLEIIPIINKIDLPSAEPERVIKEIEDVIGLDCSNAIMASAKTGQGTKEILQAICDYIPAPTGDPKAPLKALIFDSYFDAYRGAIPFIRVFEGSVKKGDRITMMKTNGSFDVTDVGIFTPAMVPTDRLSAGDVGYICASIKDVKHTKVGDTVTLINDPAQEALPGYREATSMVFCGLYPVENNQYENLKESLDKLQLNDASLVFEAETSQALGFGFRCGFLGLLHMEIVQERLEREYDINLIVTAPSVGYRVTQTDGTVIEIDNPSMMPDATKIDKIEEPMIKASIMVPSDYVGAVMELCQDKRGSFQNMDYITPDRVSIQYLIPLAEIVYNFFDQLKSRTKGYASLDYELAGYQDSKLVKLDVLLAGDVVDALSCIVHMEHSYQRGRILVSKLRKIIPRQMFEVAIQAAIGNKIIARESVKAMRKDVLAKCYGGDISRKRKLLEKQKKGKKRMKQVGRIDVPQEAFMSVLSIGDED
jgi:GTP-binding protein LepA